MQCNVVTHGLCPVLSLLCLAASAFPAEVPHILSFQGVLSQASGQPVADGPHSVRFRLFNGSEGNQTVTDEPHTVSSSTIRLGSTPIVAASEVVRKADGTVTYTRNVAYTINNSTGVITRVSAAAIPDGTALKVSYRWLPAVYWTETQTVQTSRGMFAALLGVATSLSPGALTGDDWLEVAVADGASPEVLGPRRRLAASPYALRTASLDGASGGNVSGAIRASGQVSGQGFSLYSTPFSVISPGIVGTGATSAGGDAPGIRAVGANGTGLALDALGNVNLDGNLDLDGNVNIDGTVVTTSSISTGSLFASRGVRGHATAILAGVTGEGVTGVDSSSPGVRAWSGPGGGLALEAMGDISATDDIRATGDIEAGRYITGKGALRPDYDSGLLSIAAGVNTHIITLPASVGNNIASWMVVVTYENVNVYASGSTHWVVPGSSWLSSLYHVRKDNAGATTSREMVVERTAAAPAGSLSFRVRIWVPHD